jgi:hypothetical protein
MTKNIQSVSGNILRDEDTRELACRQYGEGRRAMKGFESKLREVERFRVMAI